MSESAYQLSLFTTRGLPREWSHKQMLSVFSWVKTETVTARWTSCSIACTHAEHNEDVKSIRNLFIYPWAALNLFYWGCVDASGQGENIFFFYLIRNKELILFLYQTCQRSLPALGSKIYDPTDASIKLWLYETWHQHVWLKRQREAHSLCGVSIWTSDSAQCRTLIYVLV